MFKKEDGEQLKKEMMGELGSKFDAMVERQSKAEDCIHQLTEQLAAMSTSTDSALEQIKSRLSAVEAKQCDEEGDAKMDEESEASDGKVHEPPGKKLKGRVAVPPKSSPCRGWDGEDLVESNGSVHQC